jgi:hypothetical protein
MLSGRHATSLSQLFSLNGLLATSHSLNFVKEVEVELVELVELCL